MAHPETTARLKRYIDDVLTPVLPYMEDPSVTDIHCNDDGKIWAERNGERFFTQTILDAVTTEAIINVIASSTGNVCNATQTELHCQIPGYNARFQGTIPPTSPGPTFDIRLFSDRLYTLDDFAFPAPAMREKLEDAVANCESVLLAGATGSGKTSMLSALLSLPCMQTERVLVLEDTPEIRCTIPNRVFMLESSTMPMAHLVQISLRKKPTRIIVAEPRNGEVARQMLTAANTGHPGWLCTIHANSAELALYRLDELVREVSHESQCAMIARYVDNVVFMQAERGAHCVKEMVRVEGYEGGAFQTYAV